MSIQITFKHNDHAAMMQQQTKMHNALVGSPAYINSEIILCENPNDPTEFSLIVGENNANNLLLGFDLRADGRSCDCE